MSDRQSNRRCESCGGAMPLRTHRRTHPTTGQKVCDSCYAGAPLNPTYASQESAMQHLAHDSGDGADLSHCPFCGSGGIIGGHDGTVECQFCQRFFTVQVQPEFKSMPQTVNGQPYNVPGMPGGGPDAGDTQGERADQIGDAQTDAPAEKKDSAPPFGGDGGGDKPKPPADAKPKNPFAAALLVTSDGTALPYDSYLQRLALEHAEDRERVLAQVKVENSRRG